MLARLLRWRTKEEPVQSEDEDQVLKFLDQLVPHVKERRRSERIPFCRVVTIYYDDDPTPMPALIRDISEAGVGLLHDMPLNLDEATIRIPLDCGKTICARVAVVWCRSELRHYISGAKFVRVFEDDPIALDNDPLDELLSKLV